MLNGGQPETVQNKDMVVITATKNLQAYAYIHSVDIYGFYRASICEGGLGSRISVRPSVRLSVTRVHCNKN